MQSYRESVFIRSPKLLEEKFSLTARVDEQQCGPMRFDRPIDIGYRIPRRMARPGNPLLGVQNRDFRFCVSTCCDQFGLGPRGCFQHEPTAKRIGPDRILSRTGQSPANRVAACAAGPNPMTEDDRVWMLQVNATRRRYKIQVPKRTDAHSSWQSKAPVAPEWLAECPADLFFDAGACGRTCLHCAFPARYSVRFLSPAWSDFYVYRRQAL